MALPDLIEIIPLTAPVHAEITVPGSKSITNRALVLAALADGTVTLDGALWSEDTQVMFDCLQRLGFEVRVELDENEFCNRTITVRGRGGEIPNAGTAEQPLELFVGNAGTAARFLSAMVCLGRGVYRLSGVPRMHERPQAALFSALRELGYRVDSENGNDKLPARIYGARLCEPPRLAGDVAAGHRPALRHCTVSIEQSSQFASALLLCAERGGWQIEVVGENAEESPYVAMTTEMTRKFPKQGGKFPIEPDASSGGYFWAADWVQWVHFRNEPEFDDESARILVRHWPSSNWQIDSNYRDFRTLQKQTVSRRTDLADSIMMAIVEAPLNPPSEPAQIYSNTPLPSYAQPMEFKDLGRLRVQECDRVKALHDELKKCGAHIDWDEPHDRLIVYSDFALRPPVEPIETYNDHRVAMCFAILGLHLKGIKLRNPSCVKKTFPNFFQKLAAAPPHGLGATILDARTGRKLSHEELFAD